MSGGAGVVDIWGDGREIVVAGDDRVLQRRGASGRAKVDTAARAAAVESLFDVFRVIVEYKMVSGLPATTLAQMPPPMLLAEFPETVLLLIVVVEPLEKSPAPVTAVLVEIVLLLIVAVIAVALMPPPRRPLLPAIVLLSRRNVPEF